MQQWSRSAPQKLPGQVGPGSEFKHEETHWLRRKILNAIQRKGELAALTAKVVWMEKTPARVTF